MLNNLKKIVFIIFVIVVVVAGAIFSLMLLRGEEDTWICDDGQWVRHGSPSAPMPTKPCLTNDSGSINNNAGLANPASVRCQEQGGQLEIKDTETMGQVGICVFTDGSKCEEWAYYRGECQKGNEIVVYGPNGNQEVSLPFIISGEARGNWFFEASLPVKIVDAQGKIISQASAQALSDWMTEGFVPFRAELTGTVSQRIDGFLVLEKDNPSGLPENAAEIRIPIIVLPSNP
ncbi:MAG: DUF333 domain-containing protein [Patescibacteria group bacterium]